MDTVEILKDEVAFLQSLAPLEGAALLELGCGKAEFTRKVLAKTGARSVVALEVDRIQHRLNLEGPQDPRLTFGYGGAEAIPFDDATFDGVLMMKSLHHVPMPSLDRALAEIRRVLKPGGWAYISEPVYAGPQNDLIRLFHDEGVVRAAAIEALERAVAAGVLLQEGEYHFDMPAHYASFDDFVARHVETTHSEKNYTPEIAAELRRRFEAHMTPSGADFLKPMRVTFLRKP
ncbi:MAG TPA: class I SAM-dependent methyltransferase [Usitatibacter sp.]|nr:class I SAM-dependent methyltransferase [Usitatibacter sp.]